jgi:IS5 family transposase
LKQQTEQRANRLANTLTHFVPLAQQIIQQTTRRITQGEQVPASEKVVSLFEEHTDIIRRGKETHPVEYGHKVWVNEVEGGLATTASWKATPVTSSSGSRA